LEHCPRPPLAEATKSPEKRMTTEIDARLELIARMMPTMIATVKEFRRMGADTEDILRLLQFFVDELGDGDDDDIEAERDED
jgi:hypothetical protein